MKIGGVVSANIIPFVARPLVETGLGRVLYLCLDGTVFLLV